MRALTRRSLLAGAMAAPVAAALPVPEFAPVAQQMGQTMGGQWDVGQWDDYFREIELVIAEQQLAHPHD